jgi:hypothetical protein
MERHPYFDLWLHENPELSAHLGVEITGRVTLHEWPLSCVQLLHLSDGRQVIYKSQLRAASVEPDFFSAVNSGERDISPVSRSLLPHAELIGIFENCVGMIFEFIHAPRLEDVQLSEAEVVEHGNRLLHQISRFPTDLPVYIDISSPGKWSSFVQTTLSMLNSLIASKKFNLTTSAMVKGLADWSTSEAIVATFQAPAILNHGDLSGDNVFVTADGYKIIDWQRPVRGPAELDLATYFYTMGVEPLNYIHRGIVELNWFIHLRWFVECKLHWFQPGETYDRQVKELAELILHHSL